MPINLLESFGARLLKSAAWFVICVLLTHARPVEAADVREVPAHTATYMLPFPSNVIDGSGVPGQSFSFKEFRHIRLTGLISPGDAERLEKLVRRSDPFELVVVSFDSEGGDYREGLRLADVIHGYRVSTFVGPGDTCLSACGLAFLGGTREVLRGFLSSPHRFVHVHARVGFHAPFNRTYPTLPSVNYQTLRVVADLFYDQAREAIRALQARIGPLSLDPDFVFELLGRSADEFLLIERYREAWQNEITILANDLDQPKDLSATAAKLACGFLIEEAVGEALESVGVEAAVNWANIADPSVLTFPEGISNDTTVRVHNGGGATFTIRTSVAGLGGFTCTISNATDQIWRGNLEGSVPTIAGPDSGTSDLTRDGPFPLNAYMFLGPYLPWSAVSADDLLITGPEDLLYEGIPEELRQSDGPSFDCDGILDPAAEVICRFPSLAKADGVMVALYIYKRENGAAGILESQRSWLRQRNSLCRPKATNQTDPFELTLTGFCLLEQTIARINELKRL